MKINSQYIKISGKKIFLRYAGTGFPVLVFHQSPQSSMASVEWIKALASQFLVIAPDTPGYGFSSPLERSSDKKLTIEDFAKPLIELASELKLAQFAVIGTHTGAAIAAKVAALCPDKVCAAFFDGFPVFEQQEVTPLLQDYLPKFEPSWDGAHLSWLWSRIREQSLFFPWYQRDIEHRLDLDCRDANGMHQWAIDFLLAGESYGSAYAAAFAENGRLLAEQVACPALYCYQEGDPLKVHSQRLDFFTPSRKLNVLSSDGPSKFQTSIQFIQENTPKASKENSFLGQKENVEGHYILNKTMASISCFRKHRGRAKNRLWFHDLSHSLLSVTHHFPKNSAFNEYAIDLPGHGQTEIESRFFEPHAFSQWLLGALDFSPDVILVEGGSLAYARAITAQLGSCQIVGINSWSPDKVRQEFGFENFFPDMSPTWNGAHLLSAWQASRLSRLFWPWFKASRENKLPGELLLDNQSLARQTLSWLTSSPNLVAILAQLTRYQLPDIATQRINFCYSTAHPCKKYSPDNLPQCFDIKGNSDELWKFAESLC